MKITIIGPGGVGGYYAVKLKNSGHALNVLARGSALRAIKATGITLVGQNFTESAMPDVVTDNPEEIGISDLVILTVKAWQINDLTDRISSLVGPETTVLPVQNGVETFDNMRAKYGTNVIGGLTRMVSFTEKPGRVRNLGGEVSVTIGENNGVISPRLGEVSKAFNEAGITCYTTSDIRKALWEKFLIMANMGGIGSVARVPIGTVLSIANTRDLLARAINEVIEVGKAAGISLDDESRRKTWAFISSLPPNSTTSMQRDIESGKASELEFMSGSVTRLGKKYGVQTPIHDFIYACLLPSELRARELLDSR